MWKSRSRLKIDSWYTYLTMTIIKTKQRAFTLIELLVVIAIIGLLSSIILASLATAKAKAADAARLEDMVTIRNALNLYATSNNGQFPVGNFYTAWYGVAPYDWLTLQSDLAPADISVLPTDPSGQTGCHGQSGSPCNGQYDPHWFFYTSDFQSGEIGLTGYADPASAGTCLGHALLFLNSTETGLVSDATLSHNEKDCQFQNSADDPNAVIMVIN